MIGLIIISLLWITLSIYRDYGYIENKQRLWHSADAALRVLLSTYIGCLVAGTWTFSLVFLSAYWILFDLGLNKKRGKDLLYVGVNSIIDIAFTIIGAALKKKPGTIMVITKIIVFIISVLIFISSYGK